MLASASVSRSLGVGVVGVLALIALRSVGDPPRQPWAPQVAFAGPGGYAVLDGDVERRVTEYDELGDRTRVLAVDLPAAARVVGFGSGATGAVWFDGAKVRVAVIKGDGSFGKVETFGKKPKFMCDGMGSNEHRFAVGWAEQDDSVWIVFGPSHPATSMATQIATVAGTTWCAIAAAGAKTTMVWRMGGDQLATTQCAKGCDTPSKLTYDIRNVSIGGVGCIDGSCVIAFQSREGWTDLAWFDRKGKPRWVKRLDDIRPGGNIQLAGTGKRIALTYEQEDGAIAVALVEKSGTRSTIWTCGGELPTIAATDKRIVVAYRHRSALETKVLPL